MTAAGAEPYSRPRIALLGTGSAAVRSLARSLRAQHIEIAEPSGHDASWSWSEALDRWRSGLQPRLQRSRVVVAVLPHAFTPALLDDTAPDSWIVRVEQPLAAWVVALGAATTMCADGGSIVAVVDRPRPLDSATFSGESAVADAVEALVRSIARSERGRGVRVNAVTTPARIDRSTRTAGRLKSDSPDMTGTGVERAVAMLLDASDAVTGSIVHAETGRSWS